MKFGLFVTNNFGHKFFNVPNLYVIIFKRFLDTNTIKYLNTHLHWNFGSLLQLSEDGTSTSHVVTVWSRAPFQTWATWFQLATTLNCHRRELHYQKVYRVECLVICRVHCFTTCNGPKTCKNETTTALHAFLKLLLYVS